jgi:penicillin-binding protein 2
MKEKFTRLTAFTIAVIFIFALLVTRLLYIQVVNGDYYRTAAEEKGEKEILDPAPRGEILDRDGLKIASSTQGYNVTFSRYNSKQKDEEVNKSLIETIRIITKNGDEKKISTDALPIIIEGNNFVFSFNTSNSNTKKRMEDNFKKKYKIDTNLDAKSTLYKLAENFSAATLDNSGKYVFTDNLSNNELVQLIGLRLSISSIRYSQYRTVYVAKNVKKETAFAIMYKNNELPEISIEVAPMRHYPSGEVGSAFLGYLGKIGSESADEYANLGYDINRELIGKLGLEKALENNKDLNIRLRGEPGVRYVNVDKFGKVLRETATLDPIPGDTVVTTIDMNLQKAAEQALDDSINKISKGEGTDMPYPYANRGAAVVVDVKTGEILSLVSRPGYDPNLFAETGSISDPEMFKKVFVPDKSNETDPADLIPTPMFNYATKGSGPPGSTFKPLVGIAGLQEKVINPDTIIVDTGVYRGVPGFGGACWIWNDKRGTHGAINLARALQVSCNVFFFETGRRLGWQKFVEWSWKFGMAANPETGEKPKTGIEIEEMVGDVSSPYKYKMTNLNITMSNIVENLSNIKNGNYTITKGTEEYKIIESMLIEGLYAESKLDTIGITNKNAKRLIKNEVNTFSREANNVGQLLNASIGQGSTQLTPLQMTSFISTLVNGGSRYKLHLVKKVLNPDGTNKKEAQPELLSKVDLLPENVAAVKEGMRKVTEEGGTASRAFVNFPIPTGGKTGSASVSQFQKSQGRAAYAWYVGFAPYDNPEIAVVVVIYNAGHGGYAAPVARAIYDEYFELNKQQGNSNANSPATENPQTQNSNTNGQNQQTNNNTNSQVQTSN